MNEIEVSTPEPGIGLVRLHASDRRNALTGDMARELIAALGALDGDPTVGGIVISGGEEAFCAGAHRAVLASAEEGDDVAAQRDLLSVYQVFETLRALQAPTVASVCGPAVGAGFNLALACDAMLVGENAHLRSMFLANSIHPAGGHLRMLFDVGGQSLAVRMAALDQPLDARGALVAGLAAAIHDPQQTEAEAVRFVALAAKQPGLARAIKRSARAAGTLDMQAAAEWEGAAQIETLRKRGACEGKGPDAL